HKTQSETRRSTNSEIYEYIQTRWIFLKIKVSQPYTLSDPEFTFIEINHAHREAQKKIQKVYNISEVFGRPSNYKLNIAGKTTKDVATVVDFFDLVKPTGEEDAIAVVDKYYSHNLNKDNKLYKSKEFKKGLEQNSPEMLQNHLKYEHKPGQAQRFFEYGNEYSDDQLDYVLETMSGAIQHPV
ncbi:36756_t:CDS:2, partial [Gigaspora margarita]